ncbi:site-specific integrase [Enterococcus faecalis]|uniref:tyrosine-type recombinase/integrase n=1 Tax=Enterococcus faecalis TaxID=1351 RepID=UPI0013D661AB|nr:site-specific integrase [Enterococcus faecalis]EJM6036349.1 site-specific integrase [Enterococcus faecalis]NFA65117.1 site-specific integrase [Enterococcus faecalis]HAP3019072.1 site-specific integrase [Enterococcus faecalis]
MKQTKDRFQKSVNSRGQTVWHFQAFGTTRRGIESKRAAQLLYLQMKKEREKARKLVGIDSTFQELASKWLEYYQSLDEQKDGTYDKRKEQVQTLNRWIGNEKISGLTSEKLQQLMYTLKARGIDGETEGYAKNTLYSIRQVLNMMFKYACDFHGLNENPMHKTKMPKYKITIEELREVVLNIEEKYLTIEELRTVLNYSLIYEELPLAILFHVLFYSGCRVSEALALQSEDFDFDRNEILFYKQIARKGKTKEFTIETTKTFASARRVPVTKLIMQKIKKLIEVLNHLRKQFKFQQEEPYLFVYLTSGKRGYPFRREYVNDHIKRCIERSGVSKSFHTHLARHTMASLCASHCSLDIIKDRLGHSDRTVTKIYRHITSEEKLKPLAAFEELEK